MLASKGMLRAAMEPDSHGDCMDQGFDTVQPGELDTETCLRTLQQIKRIQCLHTWF